MSTQPDSSADPAAVNEPLPQTGHRFPVAPLVAAGLLLLTAVVSLVWSYCQILLLDEIFVLWTDNQPSLAKVVQIELHSPVPLDPIFYHLLTNLFIRVFGPNAFALRLPSLLGFLLMQVCIYLFVRRVASEQAAIVSLALPALLASLYYSIDARPYGLLLGLLALVLLSWHDAAHGSANRKASLCLLALSIALALNTHYMAILLYLPVLAAEMVRTFQRKRLDPAILASIGIGSLGMLFVLPFMKAAWMFHGHYDNAIRIEPHLIAATYADLLERHLHTHSSQFLLASLFGIFTLLALWIWKRESRKGTITLDTSSLVFRPWFPALPRQRVLPRARLHPCLRNALRRRRTHRHRHVVGDFLWLPHPKGNRCALCHASPFCRHRPSRCLSLQEYHCEFKSHSC